MRLTPSVHPHPTASQHAPRRRCAGALSLALMTLVPATGWAAPTDADHGDTAWLLTSAALVIFMCLPGVAMFYGGLVRRKNVLSVLGQCFAVASIASLVWVFAGYHLAFGQPPYCNEWFCSIDFSASLVQRGALHGRVPEAAFLMFQMAFAVITPTLALGGFAERMRFPAVLMYTGLWSLFVYAPIAHWIWGEGWLAHQGALDFAGGLAVHVTSGTSALVAAYLIGRRDTRRATPTAHSLPLVAIGGGMLLVGWFGFNGGSALAADDSAAMAVLTTHVAACTGALVWMAAEWQRHHKPSVTGLLTGAVAGLVTITPAAGFVGAAAAGAIGALGSLVCFGALNMIRTHLRVDDALDVSPIHGVGGMIGALLTGVFASSAFGGSGLASGVLHQVGIQAMAIVIVVGWTAVVSAILLLLTDRLVGLRIDSLGEVAGLDIADFGESGYIDAE